LMIPTNLAVRRSRKSVRHVVQSYLTRWRIEDVIRFIKQSYLRDATQLRIQPGDLAVARPGVDQVGRSAGLGKNRRLSPSSRRAKPSAPRALTIHY